GAAAPQAALPHERMAPCPLHVSDGGQRSPFRVAEQLALQGSDERAIGDRRPLFERLPRELIELGGARAVACKVERDQAGQTRACADVVCRKVEVFGDLPLPFSGPRPVLTEQ